MQGLLKTLTVCSLSLCNFTWLRQTVSINLKLNGIFVVFPETRHLSKNAPDFS
jgi:hypothetical protein